MDWEAFKRKNKSGKEKWSSENYTWMAICLSLLIIVEIKYEWAGFGSKYHTSTFTAEENPGGFYGSLAIQIMLVPWLIWGAFKRYRNSKRYLKGKRNKDL